MVPIETNYRFGAVLDRMFDSEDIRSTIRSFGPAYFVLEVSTRETLEHYGNFAPELLQAAKTQEDKNVYCPTLTI